MPGERLYWCREPTESELPYLILRQNGALGGKELYGFLGALTPALVPIFEKRP